MPATWHDPEKEELEKQLHQFVAANPSEAGRLLGIIAGALRDFEEAQRRRREVVAYQALSLYTLVRLPKALRTVPTMIDAAFYLFPSGRKGQSPAALRFWGEFLDAARRERPEIEWVAESRGNDVARWWAEVVEAALVSNEPEANRS